jgi:protein-S-isoprenylcysteine O-methyltransferase Ste14
MGLAFFVPAGTFRYWQAWTYMAILGIPMLCFVAHLMNKEPELLERRMRTREKERRQKTIISLSLPVFIAVLLIPGLDRRFGWSAVPLVIVIMAEIIVLAGYGLGLLVMRENRYASRVIEVEENQKVITTGPYAVIRHPLYLSGLIIYLFSPLALGSFWALLPASLLIFVYGARIRNEEKVLAEKLPGYLEYLQRVKYRLLPGIW